jgi:uncharacterized Zn finger protein
LARLAKRQAATWRQIEALIAKRSRQGYDEAAALLADLRELAVRKNRTGEFETRVEKLRARHARKTTLMHRLDREGLGAG